MEGSRDLQGVSPLGRHCLRGSGEAGKARYPVVAMGCAMRLLKWAAWLLFLLLAPKVLRKARRGGKKVAHRTRVKAPRQARKVRRAAHRSILPKPRRTLL